MIDKNREIPSSIYDKEYLMSNHLAGFDEFQIGELSSLKQAQLEKLELHEGKTMLELGFGRGEFLLHCAKMSKYVVGLDYSEAAVEIAQELLSDCENAEAIKGDCRCLSYEADSFDRVYGGDIIEHMNYQDGVSMLKEAYRVLNPGGFLLIHTSPNAWFSNFTYPILKPIIWLLKPELAKSLSEHYKVAAAVHVHEYSLFTLGKAAKEAKLGNFEVWIDSDILRSGNDIYTKDLGLIGKLATIFQGLQLFKLFFGNDLYLKATKPVL